MEGFGPDSAWIQTQLKLALNWLNIHVITWGTAAQLACVIAVLFVARLLAKQSAGWLEIKLANNPRRSIIRIHASYQEIFFLLLAIILLWFSATVAHGTAQPSNLLHTLASLATAWGVIRFTSSTIESPFWSRLIAITLWILAALNIVGWLEPTIEMMDKASFSVGQVKLSFLMVVKSLLAFAVLLWTVGFLSGVLERSFSKIQSLNPSQRVLFHKLSSIALYTIGVIVGLNIVGLDLTALTVFSGALGLGIGFGLQKVFSNLISGIILLLDKSVKPGDVIAIGDTFGWVNSLGARCVSVLTRDGKEHLIPNENLITQEVENWSYSNQKVRVHIPIGVSYNSDLHLVRKLLLQAVDEHPRILKFPKPNCLIIGFGDSSVDHDIRIWIEDPEEGVSNIKSEIYYRIWDLFKEHKVEIPFPQRDINLQPELLDALLQRLQK